MQRTFSRIRLISSFLGALLVLVAVGSFSGITAEQLKPRMVVLTDIAPNNIEPDDMESMIRLLAHADLFEIEALIATTGWSNAGGQERLDLIHAAIDAYETDLPNLMKRSIQDDFMSDESRQAIGYWPSPEYLRERSVIGSAKRGNRFIGADNTSDGSNLIIELADEADDRPLWITVWGGGNTLAQAVWQVQNTRSPEDLTTFLRNLRVYTITDQDGVQRPGNTITWNESSHQWLRREFAEDLLFIWDESAWRFQNGTGSSRWDEYAEHIQGHGALGALYPKYKYGVEGDTPSFFHIMPTGLNDPDIPEQGGWGGYFVFGMCKDNETSAFQNHSGDENSVSAKYQRYFYQATFNNFAARMDCAQNGTGNRNPVVVIDGDQSINILIRRQRESTAITLDASETYDPDGDELTFNWWIVPEAGTSAQSANIANSDSRSVTIDVPSNSAGTGIHVICEVTDNGTHNLTSYRRIIITPSD